MSERLAQRGATDCVDGIVQEVRERDNRLGRSDYCRDYCRDYCISDWMYAWIAAAVLRWAPRATLLLTSAAFLNPIM